MDKTAFVIVADHGHTNTVADADHAIELEGRSNMELEYLIESVCENGGCYDVKDTLLEASYSAVTGLNGGMAYIYVRNRANDDWTKPARYEKDVLAMANAFYQANQTGRYSGAAAKNFDFIKGRVDMILVRDTESSNTFDGPPYVVYTGKNAQGQHQTESVPSWLARNPRPGYLRMDERLQGLTRGHSASRTGDIILIPKYGEEADPDDRSYFGEELESWHGGISQDDLKIPLIVARPGAPKSATFAKVSSEVSAIPMHSDVPKIILKLLEDAPRRQ
ncbi:MAG: alkaline phosphatase family protein [Deltaproteobacteria bacterium]|nr:alkaline phosphatase family protein [Deltaproteobacteria bacterium]